jgi:hypothetical protein
MMATAYMDVLSFCDGFNHHQICALRCRLQGASAPSKKLGIVNLGRPEFLKTLILLLN